MTRLKFFDEMMIGEKYYIVNSVGGVFVGVVRGEIFKDTLRILGENTKKKMARVDINFSRDGFINCETYHLNKQDNPEYFL